MRRLCEGLDGGIHGMGGRTKGRSWLESLCGFCPCQDRFLLMLAYLLWGLKGDCKLTLTV